MKGSAYVYLVVMVMIFVVMLVYNIFSYPLSALEPNIKDYINQTVNETNSTAGSSALYTINIIDLVWKYWPLLLIFFLMIWAFVAAQKREPMYEGY
jgi:hypothetical protein